MIIGVNGLTADDVRCENEGEGVEVSIDTSGDTGASDTGAGDTGAGDTGASAGDAGDDLRSTIESAWDAQEGGEEGNEPGDQPVTAGRERDPQTGRYVQKPAGAAKAATPPSPTAPTPSAAPAKPQGPLATAPKGVPTAPPGPVRAPQAWKPGAREAWNQIPPAAQQEITRRETEIARTLQETAQVRQGYERIQHAMGPFEGMIRAELAAQGRQYDPAEVIGNVIQTAVALRTAPPMHKGDLVAQMIMTYGIDVDHVDAALQRRGYGGAQPQMQPGPGPQGQPQPQEFRDPRLDPLLQRLQIAEQERQQRTVQAVQQDLSKFAETHEFFPDVKASMAKLLRSGLATDYQTAYDMACKLDGEISSVLAQRDAAAKAGRAGASTQRALAAASSVRSTPAPPQDPGDEDDLRSTIARSWDQLETRAR